MGSVGEDNVSPTSESNATRRWLRKHLAHIMEASSGFTPSIEGKTHTLNPLRILATKTSRMVGGGLEDATPGSLVKDWLEGHSNQSTDLLTLLSMEGDAPDPHTLRRVLNNLLQVETTPYHNDDLENEASSDLPFQMPVYQQVLWVLAFGVMILGACIGNTIVIRIVLGNQRMRTTTNYFLVNLSVADLFMTLFNCIFNFVFMLKSHWAFGSIYCTISQFVAHASLAASVFTLAVISFDRFLNVMRPLKPRMSACVCRLLLCIIWVVAASIAAPILPYATTIQYDLGGRTICVILWPDGLASVSHMDYVYNVVILAVTYVVPMTAMVVCYAVIGCKLYDRRSAKTSRQADNFKSKRKVVQMLALLVGVFALCWLPYHVYFILVHHHPQLSTRPYVQHMYLAFYWLAMSNAMINPIVYYLLNARFRYFFRQLFAEMQGNLRSCVKTSDPSSSDFSADDDPFALHLQLIGDPGRCVGGRPPLLKHNNTAHSPLPLSPHHDHPVLP
ncbi:tachykinin-like peptides receptor 86C [Homarus americanus]|uniref:tachykinin-like peptides receptor 86C n=1 Tax=Homarus americanus TaxID=6706 RepID=UPI001C47CCC5|nr:tachykinin-like peptides receptor 86C [Homarus americanus]QPB70561.1 putative tachykinin-related peptide receptor I [Homarus americanus]